MADPHVFHSHGQAFAFHPGLGRFMALSPEAYDVLRACRGVPPGKIRARLGELQAPAGVLAGVLLLERQGLFHRPDGALSDAEVEKALDARFSPEAPRTEAVLALSEDCNLACGYCYCAAGTLERAKKTMDPDLALRVVERLLEASGPNRRVRVVLGGGEPLTNRAGLLRLFEAGDALASARGKRITYVMTTNAVLLDDEAAAALSARDVEVLVSLDGPQRIHDRQRRTRGGQGSFEAALAGANRLLQARGTVPVRCTLTNESPPVVELLDFFEAQGFSRVELRPALPGPRPSPFDCDDATLLEWERQEEEEVLPWIFQRIAIGTDPIYFPYREFVCGHGTDARVPTRPALFRCGACRGAAAVSADGRIYPCNRFLGMPAWRLESTNVEAAPSSAARFWRAYRKAVEPSCGRCWARTLCAGPCPHEVAAADGSFGAPRALRCEQRRRFFERGAHVLHTLQNHHPEFLARTVARGPRHGLFKPDEAAVAG